MPGKEKTLDWLKIGLTIVSMAVTVTISHMGLVNQLAVLKATNTLDHDYMKKDMTKLYRLVENSCHTNEAKVAIVTEGTNGQPETSRQ